MLINKIVDLWDRKDINKPINLKDLNIDLDLNKNIYSIDISFDGTGQELDIINQELIPYIRKKYKIASDIIIKEIATAPYNSVNIIVKCINRMDIISKLELKEKIIYILNGNQFVIDVNINEIYIC